MDLPAIYTLVSPDSNRGGFYVVTEDPRTLDAYRERGLIVIEGRYDESWELVGGKMLQRDYPLDWLGPQLKMRIRADLEQTLADGVVYEDVRFYAGSEDLIRLILAYVSPNEPKMLFIDDQLHYLSKAEMDTILYTLAAHFEKECKRAAEDIAAVDNANSAGELQKLLLRYWPELGKEP